MSTDFETGTEVKTAEDRDTLTFDLGVTLAGGVHVPVEIIIVYPEGHGLHAVQALRQAMETQVTNLYQELMHKQDASLISAMLANGAEYEEDEL